MEQSPSKAGQARAAVSGGKRGAELGQKVGGAYGAAAGAAVGAGSALLADPATRRRLALLILAPVLAVVLVAALVVSQAATMGQDQRRAAEADSTAVVLRDGVPAEDLAMYQLAAKDSGTSWPVIAAADRAAGQWAGPGQPPFGLSDLAGFNKASTARGLDPLSPAEAKDRVRAGYGWGRLLTAILHADAPDIDAGDVAAGARVIRDPADATQMIRGIDPDNTDSTTAHDKTRAAFTAALQKMPGVNGPGRIFDTAFRWSVGEQQQTQGAGACAPGGVAGTTAVIAANPATAGTAGSGTRLPAVDDFNDDQIKNAATMIAVGKKLHLPPRAWQIAIMAALVESQLLNLHFGDRDSKGLLQQRPSAGWGTEEEITNPALATAAFYGKASHTHNRGLVDVQGWESMDPGRAAQAVQVSAFPDRYATYTGVAAELVKKLATTNVAVDLPASPDSADCATATGASGQFGTCPPSPWPDSEHPTGPGQVSPDLMRVLRCAHQRFAQFTDVGTYRTDPNAQDHAVGKAADFMIPGGADDPAGKKSADELASWLVRNAKPLGVHYVIWSNKIWNVERDPKDATPYPNRWRPYSVCAPPASCGVTAAHYDHLHVSVWGDKGVLDTNSAGLAAGKWGLPTRDQYRLGPGVCTIGTVCWGYPQHTGQDFDIHLNAPIVAAAAARVKLTKVFCPTLSNAQRAGNAACSYGRLIVLDHGGGVESYYAHLNKIEPGVRAGARIKGGQVIGREGSQGHSTGPHIHFEIRQGGAVVNPITYLHKQGVDPRCGPLMQGIYDTHVPRGQCA